MEANPRKTIEETRQNDYEQWLKWQDAERQRYVELHANAIDDLGTITTALVMGFPLEVGHNNGDYINPALGDPETRQETSTESAGSIAQVAIDNALRQDALERMINSPDAQLPSAA